MIIQSIYVQNTSGHCYCNGRYYDNLKVHKTSKIHIRNDKRLTNIIKKQITKLLEITKIYSNFQLSDKYNLGNTHYINLLVYTNVNKGSLCYNR